jgi:hypothetical protein
MFEFKRVFKCFPERKSQRNQPASQPKRGVLAEKKPEPRNSCVFLNLCCHQAKNRSNLSCRQAVTRGRRACRLPAKNGIFEPFMYKSDHFTKTGSGQTCGNPKQECRFSHPGAPGPTPPCGVSQNSHTHSKRTHTFQTGR